MDLSYSKTYIDFRADVRRFLEENWEPSKAKDRQNGEAYLIAFRRKATEQGYINRFIPKRYGGSEQPADVMKAHIIREEFDRVRAPMEVPGIGVMMVVPTLLECGSEWQKDFFIPKTVSGEIRWAQGYSEPGSGSDLASLRTKAELVGNEWIINGQKIWTTRAFDAKYMFALVRTEPEAKKHAGISYILLDLHQPGVTIRPLKQISGESEFCEVFFQNARTPADWIVGKRGEGWQVSRSTLKHERGAVGSSNATEHLFSRLVDLAKSAKIDGKPAIQNPVVRDRLAALEGFVRAHLYSGYYQLTKNAQGESPGPIALMNKLNGTTIGLRVAEIASDLIEERNLLMPVFRKERATGDERWLSQIFGSLAMTIAGGTSNIQRNIIAERGLGLPRDVE